MAFLDYTGLSHFLDKIKAMVFPGATSSAAGSTGLVPAPLAGDQDKVLAGNGNWEYMSSAAKTYTLDTVTNTSGAYSHTTSFSDVTADMKPFKIELGDTSVFRDIVSVTCSDGEITLTCADVVGTSTVYVTVMKMASGTVPAVSSAEFDVLASRIGTLANLSTTAKENTVAAINELDSNKANVVSLTWGTSLSFKMDYTKCRYAMGFLANTNGVFITIWHYDEASLDVHGLPSSYTCTLGSDNKTVTIKRSDNENFGGMFTLS